MRCGGGQKAEGGDQHGHHDGTQAEDGALDGCLFDGVSAHAHLVDVLQHNDADLDGDAEEGEESDAGGDAAVGAGEEQRGESVHRGHGDGEEDEQGPLAGVEHHVEQDEDDDQRNGQHQHEAARGALLAGILTGPVDLVARRQRDLGVDLADGLFDGGAEVATAHAVLDGDVTLAGLAVDLFGPVLGLDGGQLGEGDALAGGREEADVVDGLLGVAELGKIAKDDVVSGLALEDLSDGVATDGGLDGVLHVGHIDAVARGGLAVDGVVEVGLADDAEEAEVLDALDLTHDGDDLVSLGFQCAQVVAVDFNGELAFDTADGLFDVVGDGLREVPADAWNLAEFGVHGGDQLFLVFSEDGTPLVLGLEIDEVFGVEEAGGICAVVGPPGLADDLGDLGE